MTAPDPIHGAARASLGRITFSDDIDAHARQTIREMWVSRLAGFHQFDLHRYLRYNTESTRYVKDGNSYSYSTFRRVCRVLFPLRRIAAAFGITLTAEVVDAHVTRDGDRFMTRGYLILMLNNRIVRRSRLSMSIARRSGRWVWHEAVDDQEKGAGWFSWFHQFRRSRVMHGLDFPDGQDRV